jgi:trimeric autotransporter adhesin
MGPSHRVLCLLFVFLLVAATTAGQTSLRLTESNPATNRIDNVSRSNPRALPAVAETRISAVIGRNQSAYRAERWPAGFRVENLRNALSADFSTAQVAVSARADHWAMKLSGYGYADKLRPASPVAPTADADRVEYRRGVLTEWYENGPLGLEQGFTIVSAPGKPNGPLTLALVLSGNLTATLDRGAHSLTLKRQGAAVLRYDRLLAQDANGQELKSWMEVAENHLRLRIDDAGARYPITVDPLVQSATLTDPNPDEQASDFGRSIAISGDGSTIVIGTPDPGGLLQAAPGEAYVFLRPATGWADTSTYAAKLVASNGQPFDAFGAAVSISGDGKTIAAIGVPEGPATDSV